MTTVEDFVARSSRRMEDELYVVDLLGAVARKLQNANTRDEFDEIEEGLGAAETYIRGYRMWGSTIADLYVAMKEYYAFEDLAFRTRSAKQKPAKASPPPARRRPARPPKPPA